MSFVFFFQAEDGIRDLTVTGVQTCALPISDPASLLTRLKCSNKDIERGRAIGSWKDKYPDPKHLPAVRRWLSETRSEERRVGEECRSRGAPYHYKKNENINKSIDALADQVR